MEIAGFPGPKAEVFIRERAAAQSFAAKHGGRVLSYSQIDLGVMVTLNNDGSNANSDPQHKNAPH